MKAPRYLRSVVVFVAVIGMMFGSIGMQASAQDLLAVPDTAWATSNGGVTPDFVLGNVNSCGAYGVEQLVYFDAMPQPGTEYSFDGVTTYDATPWTITFSSADGTYLNWTSTVGVNVIMKGGPNTHVYVYNPTDYIRADSGLVSPLNESGNVPNISHVIFCYVPAPEPPMEGQWCSPGYWRQDQHVDSWAATGISPTALFSTYFPDYRTDVMGGVTLWEVLQNPTIYQGRNMDAFNMVGDLLSDAHPDVDFDGTRYEETCPLD